MVGVVGVGGQQRVIGTTVTEQLKKSVYQLKKKCM